MKRRTPRSLADAAVIPAPIAPPTGGMPLARAGRTEAGELGQAVVAALSAAIARGVGFDLQAAVRARQVRLLALHTVDGRPLPSDWAIPVLPGEVVVACAPLKAPRSGVAALVVQGTVLHRPKLDDAARERIARALADALLADLKQASR